MKFIMIYFKINTYIRFVINQMTKHTINQIWKMTTQTFIFHFHLIESKTIFHLPSVFLIFLTTFTEKKKITPNRALQIWKIISFKIILLLAYNLSREKIIPENDRYTKIFYYLRIIQNIYNIHKKFIPAGGGEITYAASISISWKSHASTNGIVITTDHLLHFFPRRTTPPCLFLEIDEIRYFFLPSSIA